MGRRRVWQDAELSDSSHHLLLSHFIASSIHHIPPELPLAAGGFPGRARMSRLICGGSASSATMWSRLTSTGLPRSAGVSSGAIVNVAHQRRGIHDRLLDRRNFTRLCATSFLSGSAILVGRSDALAQGAGAAPPAGRTVKFRDGTIVPALGQGS